MSDPTAVQNVREMAALWLIGADSTTRLLANASRASACDGALPELVALACLYPDSSWWEVKDAVDVALVAYGSALLENDAEIIPVLALRWQCRLFLANEVDARHVLGFAHHFVGPDGHDSARVLADLYDYIEEPGHDDLIERDRLIPDVCSFLEASSDL